MSFNDGDIIASTCNGFVSGVINVGTFALPAPLPGAGASHVGIVCMDGGEPVVYESTSYDRPPCVYQGRSVRGVQAHRLDDYLKFDFARVWHYPLRRALYDDEARRLQHVLDRALGTPYDMLGAFRSGGLALRALLRKEDLSGVFCSE